MEFSRPVPIGVSTGHIKISAGTIGARVTDGTNEFALSNNHIYADRNKALIGDAVIQPGSVDSGTSPEDDIGALYDFTPIDFSGECTNVADAAIALSKDNLLGSETPIDGYGEPVLDVLLPSANMQVMKYGRTTGLTVGKIAAFNVTVEVSYGNDGIACFTDQMMIIPGGFSSGGDSGSLIVAKSNDGLNHPVGLLFAGSPSITVANPIGAVFNQLGVTIDTDKKRKSRKEKEKKVKDKDKNPCDENDPSCDFVPKMGNELNINVSDNEGLVGGITICVYSYAAENNCGSSRATRWFGLHDIDINWTGDINGGGSQPDVTMNEDTHYFVMTSASYDVLSFYFEEGEGDPTAKFTVSNSSTGAGVFDINNPVGADLDIVDASPSNVSVESPAYIGEEIDITWDVEWNGSDEDYFVTTATVSLVDGGLTTLASAEAQSSGSGLYTWTPTPAQIGEDVKIRVQDQTGDYAESTSFDVVYSPVSADIEGPDSREAFQSGTWDATESSGGKTPYTYDWDYMWICNEASVGIQVETCDTWNQGGTGSTFVKSASTDEFDMKLRLTVIDSDSPANYDIAYLIVDIYDP